MQNSILRKDDGIIQSETSSREYERRSENIFQMGVGFSKPAGQPGKLKHLPSSYDVRYNIDFGRLQVDRVQQTVFTSQVNPESNLDFARKYSNNEDYINQNLNFRINDFSRLLLGSGDLMGIKFGLQNYLAIYRKSQVDFVSDFDSLSNSYLANAYLSNKSNYTTIDVQPAISLKRAFIKKLVNRFDKNLSIDLLAKLQYYNQINESQKSFQNLNRWYKFFLPSGEVKYINRQFGDYITTYKLNYTSSTEYPTIFQIAPLVDSTNITDLFMGNSEVGASFRRQLTLSLSHVSERSQNPFSYEIKISAGQIDNRLSDSSLFDNQGRRQRFVINLDGSRFLGITGNLNKAIKIMQKPLTISLDNKSGLERIPSYINSKFVSSDVTRSISSLQLDFTVNTLLSLNAIQEMNFYRSKVRSNDVAEFKSSLYSTAFSISINCSKKTNVSSSISYNKNAISGLTSTQFAIWNASISQRFMKGNNLELKLAALDILRQNKGIVNYGNANSLSSGTINVLKQYFILTMACFPRKFGSK